MAVTELDRRNRLTASAEGVAGARRFVRSVLDAAGSAPEPAEVAVLLVSELASNAVLHARTSIEVRVVASERWIRVEVRDGSRVLPSPRDHRDDAMTGRGLGLVESLASSWGAHLDASGKVVWFEVGDGPQSVSPAGGSTSAVPVEPSEVVRLTDAPAALVVAALAHGDALVREVALSSAAAKDATMPAASPLDLRPVIAAAQEAVASDQEKIDVEVWYPLAAAVAASHRRTMIDHGQRLADMGIFLTAPALPEVDRCLRWVLDEISGQLTGQPVRPWKPPPPPSPSRRVGDRPSDLAPSPLAAVGMVVADRTGIILHVSAAAARMLGWGAEELVGRRLITIIPPAAREAHVVGFTRFQLTGRGRILGRTRRVQALCRDGSLIDVDLTLNALDRRGGERAVIAALEEIVAGAPPGHPDGPADQARVQTEPDV